MKKQKILIVLLAAVFLSVMGWSSASAQDPTPIVSDDQVNTLAKELYCPVCENVPLDVCPTTACSMWRELIRAKIAEGWTDDEIRDYLVMQYGDRVLAEPPRRGLNWLVYILPPLFFLGGVILLGKVLRSMQQPPEPLEEISMTKHDDPYIQKIEEELVKRLDDPT